MTIEYLNFYNNLIKLTTNKSLYEGITNNQDSFSDRLTLFLIHFAFILKEFKNPKNERILQELYDFNFRQLELSIREIGYGDQSINKKMKDYINVFHAIVSEIHFWNGLDFNERKKKLSIFLTNFNNINYLIEYFDNFRDKLSKYNLNSYLKSVSNQ
ncbi:ubiquinol-cytochrome C chaperone family protein [Candidatus Pelagibacter sp.]|nr:ubiquinol-cytochrome C chaperone family protein [Candidatus Pelagibacter sp.]